MFKSALRLLFRCLLLLGGGSAVQAQGVEAGPAFTIFLRSRIEWDEMKEVRAALGPRVRISGRTIDLRGGCISGKALKHPRQRQDEASVGVRIRIKGFTLQNGYVDDIPGGLIVLAPEVTLRNLTFTRAGEDFVSNAKDNAEGFRVLECRFHNDKNGDKSIQANDGRGLVIQGNYLTGGRTGIRIQKKDARRQGGTAVVEGNFFDSMNTAVNAAGKVTVWLGQNHYRKVWAEIRKDGSGVKVVRR